MANALNATLAGRSRNGAVLVGSVAAAMAGMALWNTYRARKVEREHPPRGRFVTVDGVRLHYLERGGGRPVVFVHGNVVTSEDFELSGLLDLAAERQCHVVAFDRPGFGYSHRPRGAMWPPARQADLLRQAFARLGIERPIIVGRSWGTLVALGAGTGPSGRGERSCPFVRLLPSDIARRCAIVLASGDPSHRRPDPLYCRATPRRRPPAVGSQGHVLATSGARPLRQRLSLRSAPTAMADPRRGSGYRHDAFGSSGHSAPLSGTAPARSDHGRHGGSRRQSSQTRCPAPSRHCAERAAAGSGCRTHGPSCRAPASRRRDRSFCEQPNNAPPHGGAR